MTRDVREYIAFQKAIARIMLWGVGFVPLFMLVVWDFMLVSPYASIIAIIAAYVMFRHAGKLSQQGVIHDR